MGQTQDSLLRYEIDSLSIYAHPLKTAFILHNNSLVVSDRNEDMAATFGDPSRVLYRSPGISMANDQANGIIHHGLPGELNTWTVYGAEILNPNHLSNAGTRFDRSSVAAGGVLALPFEVIENLTFMGTPRNASSNNSLSGLMDISFSDDGDSFLKAGLLGMEAAYQSKKKSKFKAHARYSTVGLLSDMGVDFDGESINFQDLFLSFRPSENIQVFGMLASSNNNKVAVDSLSLAVAEKDLQKIDYSSRFGFVGANFNLTNSNHTLVASYKRDKRSSVNQYAIGDPVPLIDESEYQKISYSGSRPIQLKNHQLIPALNAQFNKEMFLSNFGNYDAEYFILEPSVSFKYIGDGQNRFSYELSLSGLYDSDTDELIAEPNVNIQYYTGPNVISLDAGIVSQAVPSNLLALANRDPFNLGPVLDRMRNFSSSVTWKIVPEKGRYKFLTRLFYKRFSNLRTPENEDYMPLLNGINPDEFNSILLTGNARSKVARSYGVDVMLDYQLSDGLNLNLNGSIFDLKYRDYQNNWVDARFNFGHVLNATISKTLEFDNGKSLILHSGLHYRGAAKVIEDRNRELRPYWRVDLRAKYIWREKNILILDIQNVTNRINDAYYYFDRLTEQLELEEQLTLIPILSYKRILGK